MMITNRNSNSRKNSSKNAIKLQLKKVLLIMQTNTRVSPHAMMVHYQHALIANTAMMSPERLDFLTFFTKLGTNFLKNFIGHCI